MVRAEICSLQAIEYAKDISEDADLEAPRRAIAFRSRTVAYLKPMFTMTL